MKKLFALVLAALLLITAAGAETIEEVFAAYSLEDLQMLAAAVDAEIIRRTKESFDVPTGTYIIGQDIPAGSYRLDYIDDSLIVAVYRTQADYEDDNFFIYEGVFENEPIGKLPLSDGNILVVNAAVRFSLFKGLGW